MSESPPAGYHSVTPYAVVDDADKTIEFMERVFEATVSERMQGPDGRVVHAEVRIGDSLIMLSSATPDYPRFPMMVHLYLPDVDATYAAGLEAGATSLREPADQFYGDRSGGFEDQDGNQWWLATRFEDVSPEEMVRRLEAAG
jgi:uncharacterized glyoxalase superfamily protein PhnB